MDEVKRRCLQYHQDAIIRDLDANDIADDLFTKAAIGQDDYDKIIRMSDRVDRTRHLLNVIMRGTNDTYDKLVNSLNKDYRWLFDDLSNGEVNGNSIIIDDTYEDILSRGDVPRLPKNYIRRLKLETEIVEKLDKLKRHSSVVLYGMLGSGKSSLASAVLRNHSDLVRDQFQSIVLWLNLTECKTEDDLLPMQWKLYRKGSALLGNRNPSTVNSSTSISSMSSMMDISMNSIDCGWRDFRDKLKELFSETMIKECLIVLDNLSNKMSAEAFDIGCKMLITTTDRDAVAAINCDLVSVSSSLEENESLQLFANILEVNVKDLPSQATKLHKIYKGNIFMLKLVAGDMTDNKEMLKHNKKHWSAYLKKESILKRWTEHQPKTNKFIEIFINPLDGKLREHFKSLAVLPNNAKITAKALSTIWCENIPKVESMLKHLSHKSLITQTYVQDRKEYIYEVHELMLSCLISLHKPEELKDLHVKLLRSYGFFSKSNTIDLVDDGYMALYLGYHIDKTCNKNDEWLLFNKLFLNLKFLGNKIRLVGQADVIGDLKRYEDKICRSEIDRELHMEITQFLKGHGNDLHKYPCTDFVQSVLQHTSEGVLYRHAKDIAAEGCRDRELYFEFLHEHNSETITPAIIDVKEPISVVTFLGNEVLVGTETGKILVFGVNTCQLCKEIVNSSSKIKSICVNEQDMSLVAVLANDGVITLWPVHFFSDELNEQDVEHEGSDEEETRSNSLPSQIIIECSRGAHTNIMWNTRTDNLITHTSNTIIVYDKQGRIIDTIEEWDKECIINNITQSPDEGKYLLVSVESPRLNHSIQVVNIAKKKIVQAISNLHKAIKHIFNVPSRAMRYIAISDSEVLDLRWESNHPFKSNSFKKTSIAQLERDDLFYTSAVMNKSGNLLFVSENNGQIECFDLKKNCHLFTLNNRRGNVVSMEMSEHWPDSFLSDADVLATATGDVENIVKVWHLPTDYITNAANNQHRRARLSAVFGAAFPPPVTPTPTITPRRNCSFAFRNSPEKLSVRKTTSFDRHFLKPLNLNGLNGHCLDYGLQPLIAVVDENNSIQILRGRRLLYEIQESDPVVKVAVSPCNYYVIYGLKNGIVKKFTMPLKENTSIMDLNSSITYLEFVTEDILIVSAENSRIMFCCIKGGDVTVKMLANGNTNFGSQEMLNDKIAPRRRYMNGDSFPDFDTRSERSSDASPSNRLDRTEPLYRGCQLVKCFWLDRMGMLTIEENSSVKLWDTNMEMVSVLNGRRDVEHEGYITCASYMKRTLVLCDSHGVFQVFKLLNGDMEGTLDLRSHFISQPLNKITACALSCDGLLLAIATQAGPIVLWIVNGRRQIAFLREHKSTVHSLIFSPRDVTTNITSLGDSFNDEIPAEVTPVVLVSMATEIIWWNATHILKSRQKNYAGRRGSRNVLTPVTSPNESLNNSLDMPGVNHTDNRFFADLDPESWDVTWKGKKYKTGSPRRDVLACVKLCGITAERLYANSKFNTFATVDSTGVVHVMNVMRLHT